MRSLLRTKEIALLLATLAAIGLGRTARADVSYTEKIKFGDVGGLGKSEITRHVDLAGLKQREESLTKLIDAPGYPAGITETRDIKILRLDKNLIYTLDPKSKKYTASTIEEAKKEAIALVEQAPADQIREAADADVKFTLKKTDRTRSIGPWKAGEVVLTMHTEEQDAKTGEKRPARMTCDLWVVLDVPGAGEMRDFAQSYMDKLGAMSGMAGMRTMADAFPKCFARAFEAIKGIPGTPVEWTWTVERALSAAEAEDLKQDVSIMEEGGEDALLDQARQGQHDNADPRNLQTPSPDAPVKNETRTGPIAGGYENAAELAGVSPGTPKGVRIIMKVTTVLDKIETAPILRDRFEIPAEYAKAVPGR
jgi:hypothetical protein